MKGYSYLIIALIGTTVGQIFIKLASQKIDGLEIKKLLVNPYIYYGFFSIAIVPFFVNLALDTIELSFVYAFTGFYYITVPIAARVFLNEDIARRTFIGMFFIFTGVAFYHL